MNRVAKQLAVEVFVGPFWSVVDASNFINLGASAHDITVGDGIVTANVSALGESDSTEVRWITFEWWDEIHFFGFPLVHPCVLIAIASDLYHSG